MTDGTKLLKKCIDCGKERWVSNCYNHTSGRCPSCSVKHTHQTIRKRIVPIYGTPYSGEIRPGVDIGKERKRKYIWMKCPNCGVERWVSKRKQMTQTGHCQICAAKANSGENHGNWKGGIIRHSEGYRAIQVPKDNFFRSMGNTAGYILEHRLVMARHLNRCLLSWEIVHHRNGNRSDNRLENLELLPTKKFHVIDSQIKSLVKRQFKRIKYLESLLVRNSISFVGVI